MNSAGTNSTITNFNVGTKNTNESTLIWAIICSMLLHVLLSFVIPNLKFDAAKKPDTIVVELVKKLEPPPAILPEPIQPQPEPVKPKVIPKPLIKQLLAPTEIKNNPTPPPPTEVIAVTPKPDAIPSPVAPIAITPPEPPAVPVDTSAARDSYGNTLWGAISKHKQYPRIAQIRGWQGEAIVELVLDGDGMLKSKKIIQSSGHDVLDKQALNMIEKASPFPVPPEALRSSSFSIKVPIPFKLAEQ